MFVIRIFVIFSKTLQFFSNFYIQLLQSINMFCCFEFTQEKAIGQLGQIAKEWRFFLGDWVKWPKSVVSFWAISSFGPFHGVNPVWASSMWILISSSVGNRFEQNSHFISTSIVLAGLQVCLCSSCLDLNFFEQDLQL